MSSKTRKFIWSVPVVAAFAVIGALAAFGVLGVGNAQAQDSFDIDPGAPVIHANTSEGHQKIDLLWNAPMERGLPEFTGYIVEYIAVADGTTTAPAEADAGWMADPGSAALTSASRSLTISGLRNDDGTTFVPATGAGDVDYFVRIAATLGEATGPYAVSAAFDPAASAPDAPTGVSVSALEGSTEIEVTWDAADDGGDPITAYAVTYTVDTVAGSGTQNPTTLDGDARKVTITVSALAAGAVVEASVTATNGEGTSSAGTGTLTVAATPVSLESSSSTGSAGIKLTLIVPLTENLTGSNWVEIYLEDDYQEPSSIANAAIVFEARGAATEELDLNTTFAAAAVELDDGGELNGEDNAVVISARIPDMLSGDGTGYPLAGQTLIMVVSVDAGIKNPPEQGDHDNGFSIIGGTASRAGEAEVENIGDGDYANADGKLFTKAKISLNDEDAGRGAPITVTGTGFNNGTTATVKILAFNAAQDPAPSCAAVMDSDDSETLNQSQGGMCICRKSGTGLGVSQEGFGP